MTSPVQHIIRWAGQDWRTSRVRMRSIVTGSPSLRLVYLEILFALYEAGGSLPADIAVLQDVVALPRADIEAALPALLEIGKAGRGGLYEEERDGVLLILNRRAEEEIRDDRAFRDEQSRKGKLGGRPRKPELNQKKPRLNSEKPVPSRKKPVPSPPSPSPGPSPTPMPTEEELPFARSPSDSARRGGEVVLVFPVTGDPEKTEWALLKRKLDEYVASFPGLDVPAQLRAALQWCRDNPGRMKTARGMPRFLGAWLTDKVDRGGNRGTPLRGLDVDPRYDPRKTQGQRNRAHGARDDLPPTICDDAIISDYCANEADEKWREYDEHERAAGRIPRPRPGSAPDVDRTGEGAEGRNGGGDPRVAGGAGPAGPLLPLLPP